MPFGTPATYDKPGCFWQTTSMVGKKFTAGSPGATSLCFTAIGQPICVSMGGTFFQDWQTSHVFSTAFSPRFVGVGVRFGSVRKQRESDRGDQVVGVFCFLTVKVGNCAWLLLKKKRRTFPVKCFALKKKWT